MKIIQYIRRSCVNRGTEQEPRCEEVCIPVEIRCADPIQFDSSYPVAEREAVSGTVQVSGEFEESNAATKLDVMEAQLTYTAMMTDTLLEVQQ